MPIVGSDLEVRLSIKTGSAGNTTAQGLGALSLGKYVSITIAPTTLNGLFPLLAAADNAAGTLKQYLCLFAVNTHASLTWRAPRLWLTDPAGGTFVTIGIDPTPASLLGSSSAQALEVASITTAPAGVTFSAPETYSAGLMLGDIGPGRCKPFWVCRAAANSGGLSAEAPLLELRGGTLG